MLWSLRRTMKTQNDLQDASEGKQRSSMSRVKETSGGNLRRWRLNKGKRRLDGGLREHTRPALWSGVAAELILSASRLVSIQTGPDRTGPDQTRPDQTRPDQTRPDQTMMRL